MTYVMHRHTVVVDGGPQVIAIGGDPLHVEATRVGLGPHAPHAVDFWTLASWTAVDDRLKRTFQVFATGHPIPPQARYWGTTGRTHDGLVWHLFEIPTVNLAVTPTVEP